MVTYTNKYNINVWVNRFLIITLLPSTRDINGVRLNYNIEIWNRIRNVLYRNTLLLYLFLLVHCKNLTLRHQTLQT